MTSSGSTYPWSGGLRGVDIYIYDDIFHAFCRQRYIRLLIGQRRVCNEGFSGRHRAIRRFERSLFEVLREIL